MSLLAAFTLLGVHRIDRYGVAADVVGVHAYLAGVWAYAVGVFARPSSQPSFGVT